MKFQKQKKILKLFFFLLFIKCNFSQLASPTYEKVFSFQLIAIDISQLDGTIVAVGQNGYCVIGTLPDTFIRKQYIDTILTDVKISPDGLKYITTGIQEKIYVNNMDGTLITTLIQGHDQVIQALDISPNGTYIASGSADTKIVIWNNGNYSLITTIQEHTDAVNTLAFSNDSSLLISGSTDQTIKIITVAGFTLFQSINVGTAILKLQIYNDDTKFITSSQDFNIRIWDPSNGALLENIEIQREEDQALGLTNDGAYIISHTYNRVLKIWDTQTAAVVNTLEESTHTDIISQIIFDANGNFITISRDRSMKQWVFQEVLDSSNDNENDGEDGEEQDNNTNTKELQFPEATPGYSQILNFKQNQFLMFFQIIILLML